MLNLGKEGNAHEIGTELFLVMSLAATSSPFIVFYPILVSSLFSSFLLLHNLVNSLIKEREYCRDGKASCVPVLISPSRHSRFEIHFSAEAGPQQNTYNIVDSVFYILNLK